jgi:hypothetical protein
VALRKPSAFFGKNSEENNFPIVESDNTLREELNKVESLSEQINQLQQELTQKVVKTDLENLVVSQITEMRDNFEYLKNEIQQSNRGDLKKFKETLSNITEVVNNFVENEIPKYKKQAISNEVRVSNEIVEFKETVSDNFFGLRQEVEEKIENFYNTLNEYNNIVQAVDTAVSDNISNVEKYIRENHKELVILRQEVFSEIKKIPVGNIQENLDKLEKKIDYIRETYSKIEPEVIVKEVITETLLNEPSETENSDPLTPLNQNFVTLDQLQEHYRLFINRIQQQLSTLGGGGETRLEFLDDVDRSSAKVDGRFLKYSATTGKWVGAVGGGSGSQTLNDTLELGNTSSLGMSVGVITATAFVGDGSLLTNIPGSSNSGYANTAGIATYASSSGIATYAQTAGIATYAQTAGISTYSTRSGIATYAQTSGISTYSSTAGIATYAQTAGIATSAGTATTATNLSDAANILTGTINKDRIATTNALTVLGDLYVSNNISFGGTVTQLNTEQLQIVDADIVLGIGTTFSPNDNTANHGGIAIASTEGSPLVNLNIVPGETNPYTYKKIMWFKGSTIGAGLTDAWLFNYAVGIGSTQVPNGVRLAVGNIRLTDNTVTATTFSGSLNGNATSSTYSSTAGIATYAQSSGISTYASTAGIATYAQSSGISTYASTAGIATYAQSSGISTYASTAGISTVSQGLTGTPDINVGIVTSTVSISTQLRTRSVAEKTTLINGNTVGIAFTTGGGNVAICTNPSADITLNVTEIPTDSTFDNHSISFSVIVTQTGTARTCTAVNLNGVSRTIRWAGGSLANALSGISTINGYDIFTFTGINTVGSASTTANYVVLGSVNGGFN